MGLFDRFPWVNTHELNLDWIIQKMKEWGADAAANVAKAETAATNAATAAEPYALRAETAAGQAEAAKSSAETAQTTATSAASKAFGLANKASSSASSAQASATAAAQSAEEAKTATKWPYSGSYKGYLYKTLGSTDSYTNSNREFLTPPQDNGVLFRVSGNIPKRCSINDSTNYEYHYEKIFKVAGTVTGTKLTFSEGLLPSIPNLQIAEAEIVGLAIFEKVSGSFYQYSELPIIDATSAGIFYLTSREFNIPNDAVLDLSVEMKDASITASEATAYLYVKMKYTF